MVTVSKRSWKLQDFVAHGANVNCLALGQKSGRVLVTGGEDRKVNLWAVGKSNCIMSLSGHSAPVECVKFGNTEDLVCAGSQSGILKLWDLEAAKLVRTLASHKTLVKCIDFHPYGDFLSSGSEDTSIKLWDIRRKGCIFTYKGHIQSVTSIKFSPDGQWLVSGGEDGMVKIWDMRVGRVLTELSGHSGAITSAEFHPHEFLLAASTASRSIYFWDLESFQLVSKTEKESSVVKSLTFSVGGECLFGGCSEQLKVYGWEPARVHDTVSIGWGKVQDMAIAQDQLVGASFYLTNVMICIVDLKKVAPFCPAPQQQIKTSQLPQPFSHGQAVRKSFNKQKPRNEPKPKMDIKPIDEYETEHEEELVAPFIPNVNDYEAIFRPKRSLNRSPPPNPFSAPNDEDQVRPVTSPPEFKRSLLQPGRFSSALDNKAEFIQNRLSMPKVDNNTISRPEQIPSVNRISSISRLTALSQEKNTEPPLPTSRNICFNSPSPPIGSSSKQPFSFGGHTKLLSNNNNNNDNSPLNSISPSASDEDQSFCIPVETVFASNQTHYSNESTRVSMNSLNTAVESANVVSSQISRAVSSQSNVSLLSSESGYASSQSHVTSSESAGTTSEMDIIVPATSNTPVGLSMEDFLPAKTDGLSRNNVTEIDAVATLVKGHESMMSVLKNRQKSLKIIYALWQNKDLKCALEGAISMNEPAVVVDVLSAINLKPSVWNLDVCVILLPEIYNLLQSKYEIYMMVGCSSLRLILQNFASVIKNNTMWSTSTIGVDISKEERYNKCIKCYNSLVSIRAFLLKRQTVQGKLGQTFRELHTMLQAVDSS